MPVDGSGMERGFEVDGINGLCELSCGITTYRLPNGKIRTVRVEDEYRDGKSNGGMGAPSIQEVYDRTSDLSRDVLETPHDT